MGARWIFMLPALALSLLALILAIVGLSRDTSTGSGLPDDAIVEVSAPEPVEPVFDYSYWVATRDLSAGSTLAEEDLKPLGVSEPMQGAVSAEKNMSGQVLRRSLRQGEVLSAFHQQSINQLSQVVPPGTRAVAVSINDVSALGGLMQAGDLVDILAHFSRTPTDNQPAVLYLLNDIQVLAVYGRLQDQPVDDDQRRNRSATAVLAIPREDLPKLLLADTNGALRLALAGDLSGGDAAVADTGSAISLDDSETSAEAGSGAMVAALSSQVADSQDDDKDKPVKLEDLFPKPEPPARSAAPVRPRGHQVEIFEGSSSRSTHVQ